MELSEIHRYCIIKGHPFVTYRLPGAEKPITILSNSLPQPLTNDYSLTEEPGFIFAPFGSNDIHPAYRLKADRIIEGDTISEEEFSIIEQRIKQFIKPQNAGPDLPQPVTKTRYIEQVEIAIRACTEKQLSKVVLSRPLRIPFHANIEAAMLYQRLVARFPAAFVYILQFPGTGIWIGASPELLLSVEETNTPGTGHKIRTMALAGTRPSGATEPWGAKEQAEQEWVARYIHQQLTEAGCKEIWQSEKHTSRAGNVEHICTDFTALTNGGSSELLAALHPTPAVCGLPTETAWLMIRDIENYDRSYYTGYLGPVNIQKPSIKKTPAAQPIASLFVNLRCMQAIGDEAVLYVGGGITEDSDPLKEWQETLIKSRTLLAEIEKLQNLAH